MIDFEQKNYFLAQLFATLYYSSFITLIILAGLELAKRGFVSYHFNLVWLVLIVLVSGSLYSFFKASPQKSGVLLKVVFGLILLGMFFMISAQIGLDLINNYLLGLFIVMNIGLAWFLLMPEIKKK
jgi:hypothetical protein